MKTQQIIITLVAIFSAIVGASLAAKQYQNRPTVDISGSVSGLNHSSVGNSIAARPVDKILS